MGHASSNCCANDEKQAVEDIQACVNGLSVATTQPAAISSAAAISSTEITCSVDTVPRKGVDAWLSSDWLLRLSLFGVLVQHEAAKPGYA